MAVTMGALAVSNGSVTVRTNADVLSTTGRTKIPVPGLYRLRNIRPIKTYHLYLMRVRNVGGVLPTYIASI